MISDLQRTSGTLPLVRMPPHILLGISKVSLPCTRARGAQAGFCSNVEQKSNSDEIGGLSFHGPTATALAKQRNRPRERGTHGHVSHIVNRRAMVCGLLNDGRLGVTLQGLKTRLRIGWAILVFPFIVGEGASVKSQALSPAWNFPDAPLTVTVLELRAAQERKNGRGISSGDL
ncbi:hypothetical protein BJV74DRAFT_105858 [Russula compacta]|nr:hypothetical protein BJV74DRAFT_105858 [Russula compacta]